MKLVCPLAWLSLSAALLIPPQARPQEKSAEPSATPANPEMDRLAKALAGDWNTSESMEKSEFFPNGGSRHGIARVKLMAGGTTLVDDVHSNGSAGPLDGFVVIWWDNDAKFYRFFTCFKGSKSPCHLRGTAHWEGDTFVNEYEEIVGGKMTRCRDSFIHITPASHTLVAAMDPGDGTMKTLITPPTTRR